MKPLQEIKFIFLEETFCGSIFTSATLSEKPHANVACFFSFLPASVVKS
jgi:hypothetical protein